jgi:uroporphyrinogen III methyltransferase / synthase
METKGIVYLIGAGPGDLGLLTLRGADLLRDADVVVYDGLVNTALLRLVSPKAEIIYGGKHDRTRVVSQAALNMLLITKAREGKRVGRLKSGDPYVFGRGGEEAEKLAEAGIAFEVIPGVSSVEAAPNYAGIPLTHREFCSCYAVVTGHEDPAKPESHVHWKLLAQLPGTLVILMGLKRLREITDLLLQHGRDGQTPAALIRWGTTGRQEVLEGTLATLVDKAEAIGFQPPALTIIGDVVKLRPKLDWFGKRPLLGQRIVVTFPREISGEFVRQMNENGAEVLEIPAMKHLAPADSSPLQEALRRLKDFDWLLFSSPKSVSMFFETFFKVHDDWRALGCARIAAYGPQTAEALKALHLKVDAIPTEHLGPQIAEALSKQGPISGQKILLLRPAGASPKVPEFLAAQGMTVLDAPCYQTVVETDDFSGDAARMLKSGADWITFAGFAEVKRFNERFDLVKLSMQFPQIKFATIGPKTGDLVRALGLPVSAQATMPTLESLVEALKLAMRESV